MTYRSKEFKAEQDRLTDILRQPVNTQRVLDNIDKLPAKKEKKKSASRRRKNFHRSQDGFKTF